MSIESAVRNYLEDNFTFRMFEIDKWLNNKQIIRYKRKQDVELLKDELDFEFLCSGLNSWNIVGKHTIDYFLSEFLWQGGNRVLTKTKSKKEIKGLMLSLISNDLHETVRFDRRIEPMFSLKRIKVNKIKAIPINKRIPVDVNVGDVCYIYRDSGSSNIVDPCFIYEKNEDNTMFKIMFFTNFGDYSIQTKKLDINGYGFHSVYPTEIGRTPEEAVMNRF